MRNKFKKIFFISLGFITLSFGILGIILPLLPTTPFLLLSAFFFMRSSKKLYDWLLNHRFLGIYIYSYITFKAIDLKTKIYAISLLWISLVISMIILQNIYLSILLMIVGFGVSIHLLSLKTLSKKEMIIQRKQTVLIMD
ncbi:MAG: YbaN family protein [Candidatus Izemoplasmataceae bacterium]